MNRRKQLQQLYKEMKPEMGIFIVRSHSQNRCYIATAPNLKGKMNSTRFQLETGTHRNRELQCDWTAGPENFTIEILEKLNYDKDESKTDYSDELALLQMIWEEKLMQDNWTFY